MQYIVCKKFKGLRRGTKLECEDYIIKHNDEFVCYSHSQNAYDYLARNDDGNGLIRYDLCNQIKAIVLQNNEEYNQAVALELESLSEEDRESYEIKAHNKNDELFAKMNLDNLNCFEFYNASIEWLEGILND